VGLTDFLCNKCSLIPKVQNTEDKMNQNFDLSLKIYDLLLELKKDNDILKSEIEILKKENISMKESMNILTRIISTKETSVSTYASMTNSMPISKSEERLIETASSQSALNSSKNAFNADSGSILENKNPLKQNAANDGFKLVVRKNNKSKPNAGDMSDSAKSITSPKKSFSKPKFGNKENSSLKVVQRSKRLFLSRIDPKVLESDILEYIKTSLNQEVSCIKLKSKYNTYSSFCIKAEIDAYNVMNEPDFWPLGSLISPFRGKPLNDMKDDKTEDQS
jgi:hypothetical protein